LVLVFLSFRIFYQESFPTSWQGSYFWDYFSRWEKNNLLRY